MNPFLIAAGAQGLGKLIFGLGQKSKADNLQPFDYIPEAALENKANAERQANSTQYAGQAQDQAAIDRNTSSAIGNNTRNAKSANDVLNANSAAQARGNNAQNQIAQRVQQWRSAGLNRLTQANNQIGAYQHKNYEDYWNTKAQLQNGGNTNLFSGLGDIFTSGAAIADGKLNGGKYSNPYGGFGGFNPWGQNSYGLSGTIS